MNSFTHQYPVKQDFGGIIPNRPYARVRENARLVREHKIGFIPPQAEVRSPTVVKRLRTVYKHQNKYYRKVAPQNSLPEERLFACRELEIYRKNGIIFRNICKVIFEGILYFCKK